MSCSSESCALLKDFYHKFCSGAELKCFSWEELLVHLVDLDHSNCDAHIDRLLSLTVDHPTVRKYPLKPTFRKGFLKQFLNKVEERGLTHDGAYERLVALLAEPETDSELHYRHFPLGKRFITIQESRNFLAHGTTGLHAWQAGIALANWGIRNKEHFHFKRVFELGCGLGLTGLALIFSDSPPLSYTFSDCHPEVLQLLKQNIILNSSSEGGDEVPRRINKTNVQVLDFDWSEEGGPRLSKLFQPDVIIAADVVYDYGLIPQLCSTIKTLITSTKAYSLVACTVRSEDTLDNFLESLGDTGLEVSEDEEEEDEAGVNSKDTFFHSADLPVKIFKITLS